VESSVAVQSAAIGAIGASTCTSPTIGTIPADSLLRISVSLMVPALPFVPPPFNPDVVFNYQATAAS
jgi:hypothetical protein